MQRKIAFAPDEHYHLYNRGVDKRDIFLDDYDRNRFVKLLYLCNGTKPLIYREVERFPLTNIDRGDNLVAIGAYCLMPNHFHILVREINEGGISRFMSKLLTSYSSYFNKRYGRTGGLLEGTYRAAHADSDEYLKYLFSYIHLNPIKLIQPDWKEAGIANPEFVARHLENYRYSSYPDYLARAREETIILNKAVFPQYFIEIEAMEKAIREWLEYRTEPSVNRIT